MGPSFLVLRKSNSWKKYLPRIVEASRKLFLLYLEIKFRKKIQWHPINDGNGMFDGSTRHFIRQLLLFSVLCVSLGQRVNGILAKTGKADPVPTGFDSTELSGSCPPTSPRHSQGAIFFTH